MATFEPISPAKVANGDSAFQGFRQTLPDYILGVPSLVEVGFDPDPLFFRILHHLKEWSRDSTKVAFMKESTGIVNTFSPAGFQVFTVRLDFRWQHFE